jgi:hypothetical protein
MSIGATLQARAPQSARFFIVEETKFGGKLRLTHGDKNFRARTSREPHGKIESFSNGCTLAMLVAGMVSQEFVGA